MKLTVLCLMLMLAALVLLILALFGHATVWWAVLCVVVEGLVRTLPLGGTP